MRRIVMNPNELIELADLLDAQGKHKEADMIDEMAKKFAQDDEERDPHLPEWEHTGGPQGPGYPSQEEEEKFLKEQEESKSRVLDPEEGKRLGEQFKAMIDRDFPGGWDAFLENIQPKEGERIGKIYNINPDTGKMEEAAEDNAEDLELPAHQPGLLDLEDPSRLGNMLEDFKKNPDDSTYEALNEALQDYMRKQQDEDIASQISQHEQEKGIQWADDEETYAAKKDLFEKLAGIADRLDKLGAKKEADMVDSFIEKHATDVDWKDEADTESSKRYDSKYHHSLQVREPKKDQERVDREGRKTHHNHRQQHVEAHSLNTRYCPEHVGVSTHRVGESIYQCPLDGQVYNYEAGWTDYEGNQHPGGSLAAQTPDSTGYAVPHRIFDSRENILNRVN